MRVLYVNHTSRVSGGELSLIALLAALPADVAAGRRLPRGRAGRAAARRPASSGCRSRGPTAASACTLDRTPRALAGDGAGGAAGARGGGRPARADLVHANSIRAGLVATARAAGRRPTVVHVRDCLPPGRVSTLIAAGDRPRRRADRQLRPHPRRPRPRRRRPPTSSTTRSTLPASSSVVLDRRRRPRPARACRSGAPVLAVIAQITPWKGQDDAIRSLAALRRRHPGLRLLLVGVAQVRQRLDPLRQRRLPRSLRRLARRARPGRRRPLPRRARRRAGAPRRGRLLLVPSWEEPFGRSIIEAMAAGVPVVATERGRPARDRSATATAGLTLPPSAAAGAGRRRSTPCSSTGPVWRRWESGGARRRDCASAPSATPAPCSRSTERSHRASRWPAAGRLRIGAVPRPTRPRPKSAAGRRASREAAGVGGDPLRVEAIEVGLGERPGDRRRRRRRGPAPRSRRRSRSPARRRRRPRPPACRPPAPRRRRSRTPRRWAGRRARREA